MSDEEFFDDTDNQQIFDDTDDEVDFYAVLNIPRDAKIDEINKAFKQRSLLFHPDRHTDEEDKKEASKIFILVKKAHETLTDPHLRAIYDALGARGGWQVIRSTNPENIRKEYEFLKKLREDEIMLQRVHPVSNLLARASFAGLFQPDAAERFGFLGMSLGQSVECLFTGVDRIGLAGRVSTKENGLGEYSMQLSYKRAFTTSTHFESAISFGPSPNLIGGSMKFSYTFPKYKWTNWLNGTTLIFQPSIKYSKYGTTSYSFSPIVIIPLHPNLQGAISYRHPSMTVSLIYTELNMQKFVVNITLSTISPSIRVAYHQRYPQHGQHVEANCLLSFSEITPSIIWERRLTKYSRIGIQCLFSWPSCLLQATIRIKTTLNNWEFRLILCDQQEYLSNTITGMLMPAILATALSPFYRKPISKLMRYLERENVDETSVESKREEAQKAVNLMRETAEKIASEERRKKGLVIIEAQFGQMQDGSDRYPIAGERLIDVTIPLQALVNDSQLRIYSGKGQIPGFYDPCPGDPKMLKVLYRFHDKLHSVTVTEDQPLVLPMRAHCINNGS